MDALLWLNFSLNSLTELQCMPTTSEREGMAEKNASARDKLIPIAIFISIRVANAIKEVHFSKY